jgi:UDP-N-acetylglucosamine transferase subunit ALG13
MARVFVTVGMSSWPFDRLLTAVAGLTVEHEVFVQSGCSEVPLGCPSTAFLSPAGLEHRIRTCDVVITHAGNTVRLAQRWGRVPIAVARVAALGEAANDHQVDFLRQEETATPVVAIWEPAELADAVALHPGRAAELSRRPVPQPVAPEQLRAAMNGLCRRLVRPRPPGRR